VTGIKLVISDVDGTLVTHDKRLTDASRAAVALRRVVRGISRVYRGEKPQIESATELPRYGHVPGGSSL